MVDEGWGYNLFMVNSKLVRKYKMAISVSKSKWDDKPSLVLDYANQVKSQSSPSLHIPTYLPRGLCHLMHFWLPLFPCPAHAYLPTYLPTYTAKFNG